jgi:hypothetical protein
MKKFIHLTVVLLLTALAARAQLQRSDTKESLRGLTGVYVVVQIVDEHPEGVTTNHIESLVKSALSDAGIPAMPSPTKANVDACLSVTVDLIHQPQLDVYPFTVEVAVTQSVQLKRKVQDRVDMSAETWRRTLQGITSADRMEVVDQALKQSLAQFTQSYLAVNPVK